MHTNSDRELLDIAWKRKAYLLVLRRSEYCSEVSLGGFRNSLLESNSGSNSTTPPLVLLHKFSGETVELLEVTLFRDSLATKQHRFNILLLEHFLCYPYQHLYIVRTPVCINIRSTTTNAGPICLKNTIMILRSESRLLSKTLLNA